jgi:hypothetical protein
MRCWNFAVQAGLFFLIVSLCTSVFGQTTVDEAFKDNVSLTPQAAWTHNSPRFDRSLAVSGEVAWNGLAGLGPVVHYYPIAHLGFDAGIGMAGTGIKSGARARVVFGKGTKSGFLGFGFTSGSGSGSAAVTVTNEGNTIAFKLKRTNFLQFTGGLDVVAQKGFFFLGSVGWAHCMNRDNVVLVSGTPTDAQESAFDIAYRGGLVLGLDMGFAFKMR